MTEEAEPKRPDSATLTRELGDFLLDFSIGVHRYAMYPPGHTSLAPIVDKIMGGLVKLFASRQHLSIGVAAKQLIIEGVATDTGHPVLSDLANRLHSHQLGAVSFQLGVSADQVSQLLAAIAEESERDSLPLGLREGDELKFVIASRADYDWAAQQIDSRGLAGRCPLLLSPVHGDLEPAELADWVMRDALPVRVQIQMHKVLWPGVVRGV